MLPFTRLGAGGRSYITQGASDQVLAAEHASGASKKKNMTGDSSLLSSLRSPPKFLIV